MQSIKRDGGSIWITDGQRSVIPLFITVTSVKYKASTFYQCSLITDETGVLKNKNVSLIWVFFEINSIET